MVTPQNELSYYYFSINSNNYKIYKIFFCLIFIIQFLFLINLIFHGLIWLFEFPDALRHILQLIFLVRSLYRLIFFLLSLLNHLVINYRFLVFLFLSSFIHIKQQNFYRFFRLIKLIEFNQRNKLIHFSYLIGDALL